MRSSNPRAWLEVAAFVLYCVRHRLRNNSLAKRNKGLAAGGVELVFKVAEGFARYLDVSAHEVAADAWMELVKLPTVKNVVFALLKQVVRVNAVNVAATLVVVWLDFDDRMRRFGQLVVRRLVSLILDQFVAVFVLVVSFVEFIGLLLKFYLLIHKLVHLNVLADNRDVEPALATD